MASNFDMSSMNEELPYVQPGGGVEQIDGPVPPPPPAVRANQKSGTAAGYKAAAKKNGIPFREAGLFPPNDPLLRQLTFTPGAWPFEKHLSGTESPYELLPHGGWITGSAAAERGIDLRMFYVEPSGDDEWGTLQGAVRFGNGASIGHGFYLSAHGGAIETVLDEATAELVKVEFFPFMSTVEAAFAIRRPVPLHTTLLVQCTVTKRRSIRCWVDGKILSADGSETLATCTAQLVNMIHFV